jgi:hypothetical protein
MVRLRRATPRAGFPGAGAGPRHDPRDGGGVAADEPAYQSLNVAHAGSVEDGADESLTLV